LPEPRPCAGWSRTPDSNASVAPVAADRRAAREPAATAARLVVEWALMHRAALLDNWQRAQRHEPTLDIESLD
jgi:hypothetical protein